VSKTLYIIRISFTIYLLWRTICYVSCSQDEVDVVYKFPVIHNYPVLLIALLHKSFLTTMTFEYIYSINGSSKLYHKMAYIMYVNNKQSFISYRKIYYKSENKSNTDQWFYMRWNQVPRRRNYPLSNSYIVCPIFKSGKRNRMIYYWYENISQHLTKYLAAFAITGMAFSSEGSFTCDTELPFLRPYRKTCDSHF
jgi:hypothetical protein